MQNRNHSTSCSNVTRFPRVLLAALVTGAITIAVPVWGQIHEDLKILPGDGAENDHFSTSTAIDNGIIVVGAPWDDDNGADSGSAYLFNASTGAQFFKLLPNDGAASDNFGESVAISNGIVIVGSPNDDDPPLDSGSVYVFDASTGQQIGKLNPDDASPAIHFGESVAIHNGIIAVGAAGQGAGAAYLFDASTGNQLFKLLADDGAAFDEFGTAIDIHNGIVAVGAWEDDDDDNGADSGSAYLFDASTGDQIIKLQADDSGPSSLFGRSIAIENGIVAIGSRYGENSDGSNGSAYLFNASTGTLIAQLFSSQSGAELDLFGFSIAIDKGVVAVGAIWTGSGSQSQTGSADLFDASTGALIHGLQASDHAWFQWFGYSVAIENGVVAVGMYRDNDNGPDSGSAYVFFTNAAIDCLDLTVENLIAGKKAVFTISKGSPGARAVTVYGTKAGTTKVNNIAGYCATFGIRGVSQSKVPGGLNRTFDGNGQITFNQSIPNNAGGTRVFFQSAERGTCPNECISNLLEDVVQ